MLGTDLRRLSWLKDTIRTEEDIEQKLEARVLARSGMSGTEKNGLTSA